MLPSGGQVADQCLNVCIEQHYKPRELFLRSETINPKRQYTSRSQRENIPRLYGIGLWNTLSRWLTTAIGKLGRHRSCHLGECVLLVRTSEPTVDRTVKPDMVWFEGSSMYLIFS